MLTINRSELKSNFADAQTLANAQAWDVAGDKPAGGTDDWDPTGNPAQVAFCNKILGLLPHESRCEFWVRRVSVKFELLLCEEAVRVGTRQAMDFEAVLASEHKSLVEGIEHGCSDVEVLHALVEDLFIKTGYRYELSAGQLAGE